MLLVWCLQRTTQQWQEASQAWCLAGEVSVRLPCYVAHCVLLLPSVWQYPFKHGLHMHLPAGRDCCWQSLYRLCHNCMNHHHLARSGGPAAALQSAAGFAAFSYIMDRLQPVPEAEAALPPGHVAQVQFTSRGCQE